MYTAFFGLKQDPFSISPDPRFLFMTERHREALAHLQYGVQGTGGIVLLTGDIGTGKTTISRRFLARAPSQCKVAYIFNPRLNVIELLLSICDEFGIEPALDHDREPTVKALLDPLNAFLLASHAAGRNPVLVIDEAQNLSIEVLEQLRLLTNLETNQRKLLQIVLIGQPELRQLLASPALEQLAQRVVARFHLGALDETDTRHYIEHRMGVAGHIGPVPFAPRALRRVHRLSGGVPRRINLLCGRALLGAYAQGLHQVTPAVVERAAKEVFTPQTPGSSLRRPQAMLGLGLIVGALAAVPGVWLWQRSTSASPAPAALAMTAPSAAAAPATPSRAAATATPTQPARAPAQATVAMTASRLLPSENAGLQAIGPRWQMTAPGQDPCAAALSQQLQCYRTSRMTLNGLRQMDRPAVLRLRLPDGDGHAVLEAMDERQVTLSAGEHRWTLPSDQLSSLWQGEYVSLWRTPPGQSGRLVDGYQGTAASWMAQQLTALQRQGQLPASARTLREKVEAFERDKGIEVTGRATTTTLMLLNRASGVDEPRLAPITP
ncbi:AAA family ATPase [Hydrogenophaga sp. SL48]|uniref:AAA family ATPase n=1 Tax=Hydrogenophaga sp. SL48 TaxID=2806347 RepID=UPI001F1F3946|nr:AAA family ATPase [Hydrogenophaga sp. SL48]UJW82833.1 AAA family ATPase [Hydrogenophaga sp. SL48]